MHFATPLVAATLIRRYKRFLADIRLDDGSEVTTHCPNPGAMTGLADPSTRIWVEPNDDPRKKLKYGWRLSELPDGRLAGVDTGVPNRIVAEALAERRIPGLPAYDTVRPEVPYGEKSRIDFLLSGPDGETHLEVKNVHFRREADWAEFPDSVTKRGARHLDEMAALVAGGGRAVTLYVVQRPDCARLRIAADLDPNYAAAFHRAREAGVGALAYGTRITPKGVWLADPMWVA
ncbi:DNA/RNA nuclease SfsA [Jannaschia aquimarina]|uniref:Sugar fermentation stimulation protein homolog n=1 Tax=Jannaschia aquimarina TaxID=935700 RepID=A0A0D1D5R4_9RHOB|nr:DNA/RNA nuclease SfsA [Jannaschia aquimarina]KIT15288.1 Sugar fermentation stimulation protein A [Jannaschia aquimarina]SNT25306.1 sugar fermentation stimulation protein A [Jannaschia aquimarina]